MLLAYGYSTLKPLCTGKTHSSGLSSLRSQHCCNNLSYLFSYLVSLPSPSTSKVLADMVCAQTDQTNLLTSEVRLSQDTLGLEITGVSSSRNCLINVGWNGGMLDGPHLSNTGYQLISPGTGRSRSRVGNNEQTGQDRCCLI
jgi:hypothetical protein